MNREINTIGSKANDAVISREVVTLKAELEKFREQAKTWNKDQVQSPKPKVQSRRARRKNPAAAADPHFRAVGRGQDDVCDLLLEARPDMTRAMTCTTRPPRHGEKDGADYHFFTAEEFLKRLQAGNFLEHATVYGNSYGILKSELLSKLRDRQGCHVERGCAGRGDDPRAGGDRTGIEACVGDDFSDAAIGGRCWSSG